MAPTSTVAKVVAPEAATATAAVPSARAVTLQPRSRPAEPPDDAYDQVPLEEIFPTNASPDPRETSAIEPSSVVPYMVPETNAEPSGVAEMESTSFEPLGDATFCAHAQEPLVEMLARNPSYAWAVGLRVVDPNTPRFARPPTRAVPSVST